MIDETLQQGGEQKARGFTVDLKTLGYVSIAIVLPSLLFDFGLMSRRLPLGVKGEWTWAYQNVRPPLFTMLFPAFGAPIVILLAMYAAERFDRNQFGKVATAACLLALSGSAYAFRALTQMVSLPELQGPAYTAAIVSSDIATSHFTVAKSVRDVRMFIQDYPHLLKGLPRHSRTHPPGTVVSFWVLHRLVTDFSPIQSFFSKLFYGTDRRILGDRLLRKDNDADGHVMEACVLINRLTSIRLNSYECVSATVIGYALPIVGALAIIPFFFFCSRIIGEAWAWRASVLLATVPSIALFFSSVDQVYLLLAAIFLAVAVVALERGSAIWGVVAGGAFGGGIFLTLSLLPLAVIFVIALIVRALNRSNREEFRRPLAGALVGFIGFYVLFFVLFRFNLITTVIAALSEHRNVTVSESPRTYWRWLIWNPLDFVIFCGIPLICICSAAWVTRTGSISSEEERKKGWLFPLLVGFVVTLILMDLSGVVRGEVARIWMFLMPLPVLFACAQMKPQNGSGVAHATWIAASCFQMAQAVVLQFNVNVGFMRPW